MEAQSLILALNETRKTLLASRLLLLRGTEKRRASLVACIHPGDGVWIDNCDHVEMNGVQASLDLLFVDADHRVIAAVADLQPGSTCPQVEGAVGVLQLAAGTIQLSQTQKGDQVVLEPIVTQSVREVAGVRANRP